MRSGLFVKTAITEGEGKIHVYPCTGAHLARISRDLPFLAFERFLGLIELFSFDHRENQPGADVRHSPRFRLRLVFEVGAKGFRSRRELFRSLIKLSQSPKLL